MPKTKIQWIKNNYWRFTPDTWLDWFYYFFYDVKCRFKTWYFWYSPPWKNIKRCPACAGEKGKYKYNDWRVCEVCNGIGKINK